MLVYQLDKPLEQLFLPADTFGTFHEKQAMSLVVDIQQETLDIILQDLLAETVVPVVIKVFNARSKPVDAPRALLRKGYARVLLEETEEGKVKARRHFLKQYARESDIWDGEIGADIGEFDNRVRQQNYLRIRRQLILLQIIMICACPSRQKRIAVSSSFIKRFSQPAKWPVPDTKGSSLVVCKISILVLILTRI